MKKLLLAISLLCICTIGQAQSVNATVFSAKVASLNTTTNVWVWGESYDVDMDIEITNTKMYVSDKNHSVYTFTSGGTTKNLYDKKVISYSAYDETGINCRIELIRWVDTKLALQFYVVYSDMRFAYSVTTK